MIKEERKEVRMEVRSKEEMIKEIIIKGGFHIHADSWHPEMVSFENGFDPPIFLPLLKVVFEIS